MRGTYNVKQKSYNAVYFNLYILAWEIRMCL
jgi:hypothetical protein